MKVFVIFLVLVGFVAMPFTTQYVLAHTVHCGMFGCPVGAYGITDWHIIETMSNTMLGVSVITSIAILFLIGFQTYRKKLLQGRANELDTKHQKN